MVKYLCFFSLFFLSTTVVAQENLPNGESTALVATKYAVLLEKPRLFSKKVGTLTYGQEIHILRSRRDWLYVSQPKGRVVRGWVRSSHVEGRKPAIKAIVSEENYERLKYSHSRRIGIGCFPSVENATQKSEGVKSTEFMTLDSTRYSLNSRADFIHFLRLRQLNSIFTRPVSR